MIEEVFQCVVCRARFHTGEELRDHSCPQPFGDGVPATNDDEEDRQCESCLTVDVPLCEGCGCCQECCNCTETDCDCDACNDRRENID